MAKRYFEYKDAKSKSFGRYRSQGRRSTFAMASLVLMDKLQ